MESANLHHQYDQFQDHHAGSSSSSSLDSPSCYGSVDNSHSWTPNTSFLNAAGNFSNSNVIVANSRTDPTLKHGILNPLLQSSSVQSDLGSNWTSNSSSNSVEPFSNNVDVAYGVKEELSDSLRFTDLLNSTQSGIEDMHLYHTTSHVKNTGEESDDLSELSQKLMLKTLASTCQININAFSPGRDFFYPSAHCYVRPGIFSQIHPSIDVSNLSQSRGSACSSLDINCPAFDLLNGRFSGSIANTVHGTNLGMHGESLPFGLQRMRQSVQNHDSLSPAFIAKATEAKRPSSSLEPNKTSGPHHQVAPKKTRVDQSTRAGSAPFKVRKEKLGDRIAALQQLVAPFGKTDTASVLMEAIGYIKFLQNQVQTLSVPYMKSSRKEPNRSRQRAPTENKNDEQTTRDLKSRGLCLVPLSCMSYVATDGGSGAGIWPPPATQLPHQ